MALERSTRPIYRHLKHRGHSNLPIRTLATAVDTNKPSQPPPPPSTTSKPHTLNPNLVHTPKSERKLFEAQGQYPIASRRRRAALAQSTQIPFTQLPYQCFQEARKVLAADRQSKVDEINRIRERINTLQQSGDGAREFEQGEAGRIKRENIIRGLKEKLEKYKIYADINDPIVKKKFEDGMGDMTKPIYRHLAYNQWAQYKRKILIQRLTQMNCVPDVLPSIDPSVSTVLRFGKKRVPHGEFVLSRLSEQAPSLSVQVYDAGERLVTVAVVNPDVPDVEKDGFGYRCHFLATNIRLSPTETEVDLGNLGSEQVVLDWLPAYAQKGLRYQRMCVFILQQHAPGSTSALKQGTLDVTSLKQDERNTREGFNLRGFAQAHRLKPVGADLFRTQWDEGTSGVMRRAGIVGGDVEFKRKRVEPLPYKRLKGERFR